MNVSKFLRNARASQNALKHANTDPNELIEVNPVESDFLLFLTLLNIGRLNNDIQLFSIEASVFQLWFMALYSDIFQNADYADMLHVALDEFPKITTMNRDQQLKEGARVLTKYKLRGPKRA